jgi:hypothetical protein
MLGLHAAPDVLETDLFDIPKHIVIDPLVRAESDIAIRFYDDCPE